MEIRTDEHFYWKLGRESIYSLEVEHGITASGRNEAYGCVFGRDSLITALILLSFSRKTGDRSFLQLVRKILINLARLQGTRVNVESGEEPGKCIHEYRTEGYAHLTKGKDGWYVYPDKILRNYDTADATLLFLLAFHDFYTLTGDFFFIESHLPHIRSALDWIFLYADKNDDGLLDYSFHPKRKFGGLKTQSWMDSSDSVFFEDSDKRPSYPIAPVEVQAYAFAALKNFADFFSTREPKYAKRLSDRAKNLKQSFNAAYVRPMGRSIAVAYAIDGTGERLWSARSSMGHLLWASYRGEITPESVLAGKHVPSLVRRLTQRDIYVPGAGVRTLSSSSKKYDSVSYHNGSIWPHDTSLIAEGFDIFGYSGAAQNLRSSLMQAYKHFNTPIEVFGYEKEFKEYKGACRVQAWSAASLLVTLHALDN